LNGAAGFTLLPLSGSDHFFLRNRLCVKEGLHRRLAEAPASLMGPISIELFEPPIEIGLQLFNRAIKLLSKGDAVELSFSIVLWNRSTMPLVCGLLVFVRE